MLGGAEQRAAGAAHEQLEGAAQLVRYRSERVPADALRAALTFTFSIDAEQVEALPVLDLSASGLGVASRDVFAPPGSVLEDAELRLHDHVLWRGRAVAAYQVDSPSPRLGVRFLSDPIDLTALRMQDSALSGVLDALDEVRQARTLLDAEYRAAVADLAQLLRQLQSVLERAEAQLPADDPLHRNEEELRLLQSIHDSWAPSYHERVERLHEMSESFNERERQLSQAYAMPLLLPLLRTCPTHGRAYEKPLGYAGDFQQMRVCASPVPLGPTLYARFLHYTAQQHGLGRAIFGRLDLMTQQLTRLMEEGRPVRIASLACGPAIEIERAIERAAATTAPVELILIDQDEGALAHCDHALRRKLAAHPEVRARLTLLHLSVRQLLAPRSLEEKRMVKEGLTGLDFAYSAGLLDYLSERVASRLLQKLWSLLAPSGRLFIGNLAVSPDCTWLMDNVLAWHLQYRTAEQMQRFADQLLPAAQSSRVVSDRSGHCLFLDAVRAPHLP